MTKLLPATAFLLALACVPGGSFAQVAPPPPTPAPPLAPLFSPASQIQPGKPMPFTLRKVFHRLAHDRTETMAFTESRSFAISKNPVTQTGTLRLSKDNGLSLSYEGAKAHIVIVDDKGLIDRQPGGHERQVSIADHPELGALTDLYLNLLRGNADKLFEYADVYFAGTDRSWQLGLSPKDPNVAKRAGKVVISGTGRDVQRLENQMSSGESRLLELGKPIRNPKYTPEEAQAFFRGPA